jgi:hypothetical protein
MPRSPLALLSCSIALAGCVTGSTPTATPIAAELAVVTGPPACAQPIRDFIAFLAKEEDEGYLNRDVHQRIRSDLFGARSHCSAGRVEPALTDLAAIKRRFGYR